MPEEDKDKPDDKPPPYDPRIPPELRPIASMMETFKEAQRLSLQQNPLHISINLQLLNTEELVQIALLLKKLREAH